MARILGLSFYFHDSAAVLVSNGQIIAAAAEERFDRQKHSKVFPKKAIEYALDAGGVASIRDIDAIVFYEKPILKLQRIIETAIASWPLGFELFREKMPTFLSQRLLINDVIRTELKEYKGKIFFSEHHLSHAASAFYCSPYSDAAILTIDAVGEQETTVISIGRNNSIRSIKSLEFPNSLGLFYAAITDFLGFKVNDGEWKVMGLAASGKPGYLKEFRSIVRGNPDGSFTLDKRFFAFPYSLTQSANAVSWKTLFGFGRRQAGEELKQHHADLACSGQLVVEELILALAREAKRVSELDNLVIAGGVGLNVLANRRIETEKIFSNIWIQPAPGDDGAALGAALVVSQAVFAEQRPNPMSDAYLGPSFSNEEIAVFLNAEKVPAQFFSDDILLDQVADLLAQGKVIGWFQGRMEFGPRALGSRSILADARSSKMKDYINGMIKEREGFRPFAPVVPTEFVSDYFEVDHGTEFPFMTKILQVRNDKKNIIPAVTHVDGSARVQTVNAQSNVRLFNLLHKFGNRTGVPILLNTSFNGKGEPIVCSPKDAYDCFRKTGLDALVIGNYLITAKSKTEVNSSRCEEIFDFYTKSPFNIYASSIDAANAIIRSNPILSYKPTHKFLRQLPVNAKILDVGCGGGWFLNSCAHHYGLGGIGIDKSGSALKQGRAVARFVSSGSINQFIQRDLNEYEPELSFDLVNSLGVLHHTENCEKAVRQVARWVGEGGMLQLGLYHKNGRAPFLKFAQQLRQECSSEKEMFEGFRKIFANISDEERIFSWFRDQVLHPHETQHSFAEVATWLEGEGLTIKATSLNNYRSIPNSRDLTQIELKYEKIAHQQIFSKSKYFPGFFVVMARREEK